MQEDERAGTMIMVATQQQIVNYKIYKRYRPERVVALCTPRALEQKWCFGFHQLLDGRLVEKRISGSMDVQALMAEYSEALNGLLKETLGPVIWSWGGGQKPHATALYMLACDRRKRSDPGKHVIVYAEGNSDKILEEGASSPTDLDMALEPHEILAVHGLKVTGMKTEAQVAGQLEYIRALEAFLSDPQARNDAWAPPDYRRELEDLAANPAASFEELVKLSTRAVQPQDLNQTLEHLTNNARQGNSAANKAGQALGQLLKTLSCARELANSLNGSGLCVKKRTPCTQPSSGAQFERLACVRMCRWFKDRGEGRVTSMRFNVTVTGMNHLGLPAQDAPTAEFEFDCLMTTPSGRMIAIDFKSAGKLHAYRSQNATVTTAAGIFTKLYYMYPWIEEDLPPAAGMTDTRLENIQRRMAAIVSMDQELCPEKSTGMKLPPFFGQWLS
ncbi:MAG TPA: hypothetical protein P5069_14210 [Candidatus Hydrogenedentes bacterium]|nr:hypothetical protein [Candidatus Hydrogenedentota bacterium]